MKRCVNQYRFVMRNAKSSLRGTLEMLKRNCASACEDEDDFEALGESTKHDRQCAVAP